jgi:hypothetical protein
VTVHSLYRNGWKVVEQGHTASAMNKVPGKVPGTRKGNIPEKGICPKES